MRHEDEQDAGEGLIGLTGCPTAGRRPASVPAVPFWIPRPDQDRAAGHGRLLGDWVRSDASPGLPGYAALTFDPQEVPGLDGAANDSGATVREVSAHRGGAGIRGLRPVRVSPVAVPPKVTAPHQNLHGHPARRHVESGADAPTNPAHRRHRTQRRAPPAALHRSGHLPHPHTDRPRTAFDVLNQSSVTVQDTSAPLFPDDQRSQPT